MPIEIPDHTEVFVDANVLHSNAIKKECGLLTNDAINLALMRRHHIKNIATNDPDFGQVADLVVWKPVPISSS